MNFEEQQLEQMKQKYDAVSVPDSIDDAIREGMRRGRKKKKKRYTIGFPVLAACLLIIVLAGAIRISPAFAAYVSNIPGLDGIVKLIRFDKGLQDAVRNGFIQPVHASDSHDGVTFSIKGVIADESRMILFYKVKNQTSYDVYIQSADLFGPDGKHLKTAYGLDVGPQKEKHTGKITVSYGKHFKIPDVVTIKAKIQTADGMWKGSVNVPIDKKSFKGMKQVLPVHQTVMIQHQKIHFEKAIIYPTRIAIYVKFDPDNTKQIFGFDKLKLVDAKGEAWSPIHNGVSASLISKNKRILYFESNYFRDPKALYLKGSSVRALDKDQLDVVVDLKHKKLLKKPDDGRLSLQSLKKFDDKIRFGFTIKVNQADQLHRSFLDLFNYIYHDASGKKYSSKLGGSATSTGKDPKQNIQFTIKNEHFKGPLTFQLIDYPTRIKEPFQIKIK